MAEASYLDFLDRERIRWANPLQLGLDLGAGGSGRALTAFVQPFPLATTHCTIAAANSAEQQDWFGSAGQDRIGSVIDDTADLAQRLGPGWLTIFNGVGGGGATQRRFHLQVFERPDGHGPYPLELASSDLPDSALPLVAGWPIFTLHFRGPGPQVTADALRWLRAWMVPAGQVMANRSANVMATVHPGRDDAASELLAWVVPRHSTPARAAHFCGRLASLEMLGEIVLSTEDELRRLEARAISYAMVAEALASVEPLEVREVLRDGAT